MVAECCRRAIEQSRSRQAYASIPYTHETRSDTLVVDLRSLYCWGGSIHVDAHPDSESTPPSLQKLENLSLSGLSITTAPASPHFLTPTLLPALCRLSIHLVDIDDLGCSPSIHLSPVAAQLRHLSITDFTPPYPAFLAKCTDLIALDCTFSSLNSEQPRFHPPVRFLRFRYRDPNEILMFSLVLQRAVEWGLVGMGTKIFHGVTRVDQNRMDARGVWVESFVHLGAELHFADGELSRSWVENREDFAGPFWDFSRWVDEQTMTLTSRS